MVGSMQPEFQKALLAENWDMIQDLYLSDDYDQDYLCLVIKDYYSLNGMST